MTPRVTDRTLYWVALNLLPFPPLGARSIHRAAGGLDGLLGLSCRDLLRLGTGNVDPAKGGAAPSAPEWWARVRAGEIGHASPRFDHGETPSGESLVRAAEREVATAAGRGIGLVTIEAAAYPPLLAVIASPPPVLYYIGDPGVLGPADTRERKGVAETPGAAATPRDTKTPGDALPHPPINWWSADDGEGSPDPLSEAAGSLCIAVVGSRAPTDYGSLVARRLARHLAGAGAVVVSGLARGTDTEAHRGALDAAGRTVAVLGGGLGPLLEGGAPSVPAISPARIPLLRRIAENGLVLSEYPLGTPPLRAHFPRRNRIIAGLSAALAVIEAAGTSGALITARLALEEGREVFAVPGRITNPTAAGTNGLIRSGAAAMLVTEESLLEELPAFWRRRLPPPPGAEGSATGKPLRFDPSTLPGLTPPERSLLGHLRADEPTSTDRLVEKCGLAPGDLLSLLAGLEIRGLVRSLPGSRYLLQP